MNIINVVLFIFFTYIVYRNFSAILNKKETTYNKIIDITTNTSLLVFVLIIVYLYYNQKLGETVLQYTGYKTGTGNIDVPLGLKNELDYNFVLYLSSMGLVVLFVITGLFISVKNYTMFNKFIVSGESHNNLKTVPKFYIETDEPCSFYMDSKLNDDVEESFKNQNDDKCPATSFMNEYTDSEQKLNLCDFYYNSSFNSCVSSTDNKTVLNLDNLRKIIYSPKSNGFGMRFVHFEVFSTGELGDTSAFPIVSAEELYQNSPPLDFDKVMIFLKENIFNNQYLQKCISPFFIYLDFKFDTADINIYNKIALSLKKNFKNDFLDKRYGFNGRNGKYNVSECPIENAFKKVVLLTNKYPTYSILDEYINLSTSDKYQCELIEYKEDYHKFNTGLATKTPIMNLINQSRRQFTIVTPSKNVNPNFKDCLSYGIQFTLINPFFLNKNYTKLNQSNSQMIDEFRYQYNSILLKNKTMRYIEQKKPVLYKQKSYNKLNNTQSLEIIPGFAPPTEKSGFNTEN